KDGLGVMECRVGQAQLLPQVDEHLAPTRMRHPEADIRLGEAVSLEKRSERPLDKREGYLGDFGAQNYAELAVSVLESNKIEMLRIKERCEVHNRGVRTLRP